MIQVMEQRSSSFVFGNVDWTTGFLLNEGNLTDAYQQDQLQHQHHSQVLLAPPPLSVVQLTSTATHPTTCYTIASTTERIASCSGPSTSCAGFHVTQQHSNSASIHHRPLSYDKEISLDSQQRPTRFLQRYPFGRSPSIINPNPVNGFSSTFSHPIPGSSNFHPDSLCIMTSRTKSSKGKDRIAHKRGTSVMSEPTEEMRSPHSSKFQRSHSSSLVDYDDLQSIYTRELNREDDEEYDAQEDSAMMTPSPTPSDEPRSIRGGRQNHSEIEKRRRDKMNTFITELSRVVPMCITMSHKLDKLTVLRMAVQHLKTIRGAIHSYTEGDYKPAFLSDEELKRLILRSADGFLFVVGCDRGRMLYVSESVSQVLNYSQGDLLGQSWFDILHPKDVTKVKEQLSSSDISPRERLIDAKTMLPVKAEVPDGLTRLCPGARRSFFCRMKCRPAQTVKGHHSDVAGGSYKHKKAHNLSKVVHCTGYLKSWAPAKIGVHDQDAEGDVDACNLSCLVAVGRIQPSTLLVSRNNPAPSVTAEMGASKQPGVPRTQDVEFISRHSIDGKFLFVDQRATLLLGLLPQELLGTSMYEYYHVDDIVGLTETHKTALQTTDTITTAIYRFRIKEGIYVKLQSRWKSFRNPWTKDIEFLVAKNAYITSESSDVNGPCTDAVVQNFSSDLLYSPGSRMGNTSAPTRIRLFSMELEANKIGQTVADEVLDSQRSRSSASAISSAVRSPGSILSGSTTASPFSNVGSPLDSEGGYVMAGGVNVTSSMNDVLDAVSLVFTDRTSLAVYFRPQDLRRTTAVGIGPNMVPIVAVTNSDSNQPPNTSSHIGNTSGTNNSANHMSMLRGSTNNHNNNHNYAKIRNNTQYGQILNEAGLQADEDMMEVIGGLLMDQSHGSSRESSAPADGNDEAAMAVVMSLLEADAGLGGPVDFSGLPWPLP